MYDLALLGLEDPNSCWKEENGTKEELATMVADILSSKAPMLQDYFSIEIDETKTLWSLPLLLGKFNSVFNQNISISYIVSSSYLHNFTVFVENYSPDISHLPLYVLRLACDVCWENEKPCFQGICRETACFFSNISITDSNVSC